MGVGGRGGGWGVLAAEKRRLFSVSLHCSTPAAPADSSHFYPGLKIFWYCICQTQKESWFVPWWLLGVWSECSKQFRWSEGPSVSTVSILLWILNRYTVSNLVYYFYLTFLLFLLLIAPWLRVRSKWVFKAVKLVRLLPPLSPCPLPARQAGERLNTWREKSQVPKTDLLLPCRPL